MVPYPDYKTFLPPQRAKKWRMTAISDPMSERKEGASETVFLAPLLVFLLGHS